MRKTLISIFFFVFLLNTSALMAANYTYITAKQLKDKITANEQLSLVDIQFEGAYKAGHFPDAITTYAYPVKTAESKAKIEAQLATFKDGNTPVIIISHRGGGGAMRAFDYLKEKGIDESRLFILKKGMQAWTDKDMLEVTLD